MPHLYGDNDMSRDGWYMPDGSEPWTVVAITERDQPAARFGARGRTTHVEMTDHPLNRKRSYDHRAEAQRLADIANEALEVSREHPEDSHLAEFHADVDYYEVALRDGAELIVSGDNAGP
jgi:hypothetical protein